MKAASRLAVFREIAEYRGHGARHAMPCKGGKTGYIFCGRSGMLCFLLFWAFCGSFYLGAWLCYVGIKGFFQAGMSVNGAALILLAIGLFFLCHVSFMGFYHQVN
jgi:hypothetical protein